MLFWSLTLVIITSVVLFFRHRYRWFKRAGVNYLTPIPPLGNFTRSICRLEHFNKTVLTLYNAFPEDRFVGLYQFASPFVVIRDLDLIKKITIKDFDHFVDHNLIVEDESNDEIFTKTLILLRGSKWKEMRATLSPAFTSSKIRQMVPFMTEVGDQMHQAFYDKIQQSEEKYIDFDARNLTTCYTNDVIASCAYGIKINSYTDENNQFYVNGKAVTSNNFSFVQLIKLFGFLLFPKLMTKMKFELFSTPHTKFFIETLRNLMREREEKKIVRHDMVNLLMEVKNGNLSHNEETPNEAEGFATTEEFSLGQKKNTRVWSDDELVAQAFIFFLAGFETVATMMTFMLYELARNPNEQDKLAAEIKQFDAENSGKVDFNSIQQMSYLDMVVSETLRLYTPLAITDRKCVKDYNLGKPNDTATMDYIIKKGEVIGLPIWGIHRDPKYFPDPEKFDPERFSLENRYKIKPFSYFPFGMGPRNCIASRFALCEMKVMVYQLLKNFELSPNERTTIPFELAVDSFNLRLKRGHSLRLKLRH